ncbi:RNA 2',3'-cyclic phosphodiesterase [Alkalicoccobacillus porphyridii]|uniref:RNA 2',3'-cyclic phosphodiesterase n=1 Tax=Alkalicoccobacillus porphyridii TaxID=2597270 RepID=A0A554A337_9BACI|nr:RNA 2',3'-cyclic phosphodiesterase [Alkalicoccobacillus porphyridii]TSB48109.1 RNA 2',3'-cyclic phosphodiesterase [Alkalicoccobacillus porphyridii]
MRNHYFIAIPLPEPFKEEIHGTLKGTWSSDAFKKWVHPSDYHLTLVFLGDVAPERLEELLKKLKGTLRSVPPFHLNIDETGIFGQLTQPRIYWLGLQLSEALQTLQQEVLECVKEEGLEVDTKPFKPHITLARKWNLQAPYGHKSLGLAERTFEVSKIFLYQTAPQKEPKYRPINQLLLGDA